MNAKQKAEQAVKTMAQSFADISGETVHGSLGESSNGATVTFYFASERGADVAASASKGIFGRSPDARRPARGSIGPSLRWRFS